MLKILALVLLMQQPIHGVDFECLNYSPQLKLNLSEKVEILSTKTTYMVARQYIKSRYPSKWPLETNFCTPVYFFFLSRHSIRFPSAKWIKILRDFSAELKPHLLQSNAVPQDFKSRLENWKYGFADEDDNHVTLSGFHTTGEIGKIGGFLFQIYQLFLQPKFFTTYFPSCLTSEKRISMWEFRQKFAPRKQPMHLSTDWLRNNSMRNNASGIEWKRQTVFYSIVVQLIF